MLTFLDEFPQLGYIGVFLYRFRDGFLGALVMVPPAADVTVYISGECVQALSKRAEFGIDKRKLPPQLRCFPCEPPDDRILLLCGYPVSSVGRAF